MMNSMCAKGKMSSRVIKTLEQSHEIQGAIDCGIDIDALIDNLKRTPEERIRRHQIALDAMKALQKAKHLELICPYFMVQPL